MNLKILRRVFTTLCLVGLALVIPTGDAIGAPGDRDDSFGVDGYAVPPAGWESLGIVDLEVMADDRIVVVGRDLTRTPSHIVVARFTSDGMPDTTFSGDGIREFVSGDESVPVALDVNTAGDIAVVGTSTTGGTRSSIVHIISSAGDSFSTCLPSGFGVGSGYSFGGGVGFGVSGDVFVSGGGEYELQVIKCSSSGVFDTSFGGGDGIASVATAGFPLRIMKRVVHLSGGGVLVGGVTAGESGYAPKFVDYVKFSSSGIQDLSFGDGGRVREEADGQYHYDIQAVALENGGFLIGHYGNRTYTVHKYSGTGSPDAEFNAKTDEGFGLVLGKDHGFNHLALESNGSILAVFQRGNDWESRAYQFDTNGSLLDHFSSIGRYYDATGTEFVSWEQDPKAVFMGVEALGVQSSGKIIYGGEYVSSEVEGETVTVFRLARLLREGGDPLNPKPTTAPSIVGDPVVGGSVECSKGVWAFEPTSFSYTWHLNGVIITGASSSAYVPVVSDLGGALSCSVVASNAGGSFSSTSSAVAVKPSVEVVTPTVVQPTVGIAEAGRVVKISKKKRLFELTLSCPSGVVGDACSASLLFKMTLSGSSKKVTFSCIVSGIKAGSSKRAKCQVPKKIYRKMKPRTKNRTVVTATGKDATTPNPLTSTSSTKLSLRR